MGFSAFPKSKSLRAPGIPCFVFERAPPFGVTKKTVAVSGELGLEVGVPPAAKKKAP
jgi:hypothetical protein